MSAYEIPVLRFSAEAAADINRRRFVMINSDGKGVEATAAEQAIGVSLNDPKSGEVLEIIDGIVMVEASAEIAAGASVEVAAGGKAVTATSGDVVGIAITAAGGDEELLAVKLK